MEFLKKVGEKLEKFYIWFTKTCQPIEDKIYEATGKRIQIGFIIVGAITIVVMFFVAISIVKMCFSIL